MNKVVFIGGAGRSGSTLLDMLLGQKVVVTLLTWPLLLKYGYLGDGYLKGRPEAPLSMKRSS